MTKSQTNISIFKFGITDLIVLFAIISSLYFQLDYFADDPGVGWHLKTGEYVELNGPPLYDPFLYGASDREWVSDQWLCDLVLWKTFELGSWPFLYAVVISIFFISFLYILLSGSTKITGSCLASAVAILLCFKVSQVHFILRPVVFSFLFCSLVYVLSYGLYRTIRSDTDSCCKSFRKSFIVLPLTFLLWANIHPSFVIGLFILGLSVFAALIESILLPDTKEPPSKLITAKCVVLFLGCLLLTLANPYGYDLHQSIFSLRDSSFFMRLNTEWLSPDFLSGEGKLMLTILLVMIVALFFGTPRAGWNFLDFLLVISFTYFAFQAVRLLPFFGIVVCIPLSKAFIALGDAQIFRYYPLFGRVKSLIKTTDDREATTAKGAAVLAVMIAGILITSLTSASLLAIHKPAGPTKGAYPYASLGYLLSTVQNETEVPVVSTPDWGGFITFFGNDVLKPVIDDRNTLIGEAAYREFMEAMKPGDLFFEYLNKHNAKYLLLRADAKLVNYLRTGNACTELRTDEVSVLFSCVELKNETD